MFTVEQLESKVKELAAQVEQSAANHHILVGSKMTFEALLAEARKGAQAEGLTPAVEAALDAVGEI